MLKIKGIGVSPGIAVGKVVIIDRRQVKIQKKHVQAGEVDLEINRLAKAITLTGDQIHSVKEKIKGKHDSEGMHILDAHLKMALDPHLFAEIKEVIRNNLVNAEWALKTVFKRYRQALENAGDSYLRDRRSDFDYVSERMLSNLLKKNPKLLERNWEDCIVIAHDVSPTDASLLISQKVKAFVTIQGGKTSHTAIIAHAMGVPAVVGAEGVLEEAGEDDIVVVDGFCGDTILSPNPLMLEKYMALERLYQRYGRKLKEQAVYPANTLDNNKVNLFANIEFYEETSHLKESGAEGVGLYRTEFLFLGKKELPGLDEQIQVYSKIAKSVEPMPLVVRTIDVGGDKLLDAPRFKNQTNPYLGYRAIRFCLDEPKIFKDQLRAIMMSNIYGNIKVLIPMISTVREMEETRGIYNSVSSEVRASGQNIKIPPLGCMLEVPSVVYIIEELSGLVDFFSIGTNDLTQYTLGVDRNNELVANLYNSLDPAVLRTLDKLVSFSLKQNIPVSLCGEMAGDIFSIPLLIGSGLESFSMSIPYIPEIKSIIRGLKTNECRDLWSRCLKMRSVEEIQNSLEHFISDRFPPNIFRQQIERN